MFRNPLARTVTDFGVNGKRGDQIALITLGQSVELFDDVRSPDDRSTAERAVDDIIDRGFSRSRDLREALRTLRVDGADPDF